MTRITPFVLVFLSMRGAFASAEDARAAQIAAARAGAMIQLAEDITSERLAPRLSVREFLERTGQTAELNDLLRRADQIGGPRWLDDQTCQVKLSVSGQRVAKLLEDVAQDLGPKSPIPAAAIRMKLRDWSGRSFQATGTSISASRLEELRPTDSPAWAQVGDAERKRALTGAANDAARRVADAVRNPPAAPNQTAAHLLAAKSASDQFSDWLRTRPVTNVRFHDDLSVDLTLGVTGDEVFDAIHRAAGDTTPSPPTPNVTFLDSGRDLSEARRAFEAQFAPPLGYGRADRATVSATSPTRISLPTRPPEWVRLPLTAGATAASAGSRIKTLRAAEAQAIEKLRTQIDALPIARDARLADAAKQDVAVAHAIAAALARARAVKVDYSPTGDATVRVELDPRDLWDELTRLP